MAWRLTWVSLRGEYVPLRVSGFDSHARRIFSASQCTGKTKRSLFFFIFTKRDHAANFYQEQSVLRAQALWGFSSQCECELPKIFFVNILEFLNNFFFFEVFCWFPSLFFFSKKDFFSFYWRFVASIFWGFHFWNLFFEHKGSRLWEISAMSVFQTNFKSLKRVPLSIESLSTHRWWALSRSFIPGLLIWSLTKNNAIGGEWLNEKGNGELFDYCDLRPSHFEVTASSRPLLDRVAPDLAAPEKSTDLGKQNCSFAVYPAVMGNLFFSFFVHLVDGKWVNFCLSYRSPRALYAFRKNAEKNICCESDSTSDLGNHCRPDFLPTSP